MPEWVEWCKWNGQKTTFGSFDVGSSQTLDSVCLLPGASHCTYPQDHIQIMKYHFRMGGIRTQRRQNNGLIQVKGQHKPTISRKDNQGQSTTLSLCSNKNGWCQFSYPARQVNGQILQGSQKRNFLDIRKRKILQDWKKLNSDPTASVEIF